MSGGNNISAKRTHQKNRFAFPDDLEIPDAALKDRKYLSSYVRILNDPRVYKRRRMNGDRTSSRFDVDYNIQIRVVYNEPIVRTKSILANTQSPKENKPDESGIRKSVSFLSKITFIDSIELDGVSSDWTDIEIDDSRGEKSKKKSKISKDAKLEEKKFKKEAAVSNDIPSSKNGKKTKDKSSSSSKNGHKFKSNPKELFKFKITKPLRKFCRPKEKKLKHLQKKFGRRMFKAFVHVKRSFNIKTTPDKVTVPLEKITLKTNDVTATPEKIVPSIQNFLIGQVTKTVKVSLTPVQGNTGDTNEAIISNAEIIQSDLMESNSTETVQDSSGGNKENNVESDNPVDRLGREEHPETNQSTVSAPSIESSNSDQTTKINGELVSAETNDSPAETIVSCNETEPSPEVAKPNPLPNLIDKITCNMYYNTNNDETITMNGQMLESNNADHHIDLVDNISAFNVSFSMPTKSLTENILGCDSAEIASIQLKLND